MGSLAIAASELFFFAVSYRFMQRILRSAHGLRPTTRFEGFKTSVGDSVNARRREHRDSFIGEAHTGEI